MRWKTYFRLEDRAEKAEMQYLEESLLELPLALLYNFLIRVAHGTLPWSAVLRLRKPQRWQNF